MIDIHCHILSNIDDGSTSMQESISLLKKAMDAGVEEIILTPHFILGSKYSVERKEKEKRFQKLLEEVKKQNLTVKLHIGNEVFYENNLYSLLKEEKINTLNNSRYLLFEIPRHNIVNGLEDTLYNLKMKNISLILAHPERYADFQKHPEKIMKLKEQDLLFQCNIGSFYGCYGKEAQKLVKLLASHHMIDFLATDIHHEKEDIYDYYERLKNDHILDKEYYEKLTQENPKKVINNEIIESQDYTKFKKNLFGKWS